MQIHKKLAIHLFVLFTCRGCSSYCPICSRLLSSFCDVSLFRLVLCQFQCQGWSDAPVALMGNGPEHVPKLCSGSSSRVHQMTGPAKWPVRHMVCRGNRHEPGFRHQRPLCYEVQLCRTLPLNPGSTPNPDPVRDRHPAVRAGYQQK